MPYPEDISEDDIRKEDSELLDILLKDTTTNENILWGTDDYSFLGPRYKCGAHIYPELVTGKNKDIVRPRSKKDADKCAIRVKDMAEVFTPSWMCNMQNNLLDEAWFGRKNVFNRETKNSREADTGKIAFPDRAGKTWKDYVFSTRLEVSCGEAPYIACRYDAVTGEPVPLRERIGILDRKLRVVSEHTRRRERWTEYAQEALKSVYAFEFQGDSLLLARENLLFTYADYFEEKFGEAPKFAELHDPARIIAWNVWQMDGTRCVVPYTCRDEESSQTMLEGMGVPAEKIPCLGCSRNNIKLHNGKKCKIMDWRAGREMEFATLLDGGAL